MAPGAAYYERGLVWIAHHRGGHNGNWPPREARQCIGWGCVKMLAAIHDMNAHDVAADLVDYLERSEHGSPQP